MISFQENWVRSDGKKLEIGQVVCEENVRSGELIPAPHAKFTVEQALQYLRKLQTNGHQL